MITAPINYLTTKENLKELIDVGIGKFYMGYMPKPWYQKYGWEISTNKRYFPVIPHIIDPKKAKELISFIHDNKREVFLALNELYYAKKQYSLLFKIIDLFESLDIDAYIVSDLALILEMRKKGVNKRINLSSCAGMHNISALRFYQQLGIKYFVLSQELSVKEIIYFLENTSEDICFEILLIGEFCKFNNAFCFTSHGFNRENFCSTNFNKYLISREDNFIKESNPNFYHINSWCGLCIIPYLVRFKKRITFKLPFRSASSSTRGIEVMDLAKKLSTLLKKKKINLKQCRAILGDSCEKTACAYQLL